jgi:carbonic anhydrase
MGHPDEVVAYLAAGNDRYASGLAEPRDYAAERAATYEVQEPLAAILACSDSRVPVEQIFDCGLGDLIVVRTAGHIADDAVMRTLAFAVEELGVGAIVVLAHTNCAAVESASRPVPAGSAADWIAGRVRGSLIGAAADEPSAPEIAHARETARKVGDINAVREGVLGGRLTVRPALYDLETGRITWLAESG